MTNRIFSIAGEPGIYPFTGGLYPEGYKSRRPTIREFAGHGLALDTNSRHLMLLKQGATGLSTAFDLPTLMGRDSDDPLCEGQTGWDGVAVDTLYDMEGIFKGIPLDKTSVSMTINAPASVLWAMYIAMAQRRGISPGQLSGTIQNDILKEYLSQKEFFLPEEYGVKLVIDTIEYAARNMPKWYPISISGYHTREAGSTAVQEVAYTLSAGIEYVRKSIERGLKIEEFGPRLSFFFDAHNNIVEEVSKLRAARSLWARIMHERFGVPISSKALWCRMHVQTAGVTLTRQEPQNNIVRVAIQNLICLLGGAQSMHNNSWDEVLCTPTEEAAKIAVRTQQILQEETGICEYPDLVAGAYIFERKTMEIEEAAEAEIDTIENMGGMLAALKAGYPQRMIRKSAFEYESMVERGDITVIGVNKFSCDENEEPISVSEELEKRMEFEAHQIERLNRVRGWRNKFHVEKALQELREAAQKDMNIMPYLVRAVSTYASLGEICSAFKEVWGEYKERDLFGSYPHTSTMKEAVEKYRLQRPFRILLAKGGLDGHDRIMHTLMEFYKDLGAEVIYPGLHCSMKEIAKRAVEEDVDMVGLSTHIGSPIVFFSRLSQYLREAGSQDTVVIGGGVIRARELKALSALGVKKFFPVGSSFEDIAKFVYEEASN